MEKVKKISFKNAEIIFDEDDGLKIIERLKEDEVHTDLEQALREFEGIQNLAISVSTKSEV